MELVQSFPSFSILMCMFGGIISSAVHNGKAARRINTCLLVIVTAMSLCVCAFTIKSGDYYIYQMGRFSAPWGNELRVGILEAMMALFFCIIMLLSMVGGSLEREKEIEKGKANLYYVLANLLLSSLLALVYTNDIFTAYVFIEINTISACGLIMVNQHGKNIEAAARYMVMSLLGSGLVLLGLCWLYSITGHLLMMNIHEAVVALVQNGSYHVPLVVSVTMMVTGLAIKSALFPFHTWLPDAYGYSTLSSAAILSSLVSKGYLFLVIKIFYRVIGFDIICDEKIVNVLFVFGIAGMIFGSIDAIRENDIRRMIAYSSVAQIGYIYMGFGLGTTYGMIASIYHILVHAATKSLLFICASGLTDASNGKRDFLSLTGAAYRNKLAGVTFMVGSLSMIGFPAFGGFISKLLFAEAGVECKNKMLLTFLALAISTILNAVYFMKTTVRIYTPTHKSRVEVDTTGYENVTVKMQPAKSFSMVLLIVLNFVLGLASDPIVDLISKGLAMFS